MKTRITRQFLAERARQKSRLPVSVPILAALFLAACLFFVPFPISLIPVAVVVLAALLLYVRSRKMQKQAPDPACAYLRLKPVADKGSRDDYDGEQSTGTVFWLTFDPGETVYVDGAAYRAAEPGRLFYVVYDGKTNRPYDCFDADLYEADESLLG
ncbi:MAG: hypothetical protein IKQ87_04235 [Clostridia bacterium]|nr:hypothetical protein [Clostridia bacterium]